MKRPYTEGELELLGHKIILCQYAMLVLEPLLKDANGGLIRGNDSDFFENMRVSFYTEALQIHFCAIVSCFHNNKDEVIFSRLNSSPEQLKALYKLRSVPAHILGFEEVDELYESYFKIASKIPLIAEYEILKSYVIELLDDGHKSKSDYLKYELNEIKKRFIA
jgi:hypothetical protein